MIQFKKIREQLLIVFGLVFVGLIIWLCAVLIFFLGRVLNKSLSFEQPLIRPGEFDTATFEELNLLQEQRSGGIPRTIVEKKAAIVSTTTMSTSTTISSSTATSSILTP